MATPETPSIAEPDSIEHNESPNTKYRLADQFGRSTEVYNGGVLFVLACWIATAMIYVGCLDIYLVRYSELFIILAASYNIGIAVLGTIMALQLVLVFSRLRALMLHAGAKPNQVPGSGALSGLISTVLLAVRGRMSLGGTTRKARFITLASVVWCAMCYLMSWCVLLIGPNISENGYRTRVANNVKVVKNISAYLNAFSTNLTANTTDAGTGEALSNRSYISWTLDEEYSEKSPEFGILDFLLFHWVLIIMGYGDCLTFLSPIYLRLQGQMLEDI